MISVNLLPDSKMNRQLAAQRQRRIGAFSVVAILVGIGLPIILIVIWGGQKALIALTQSSIDDKIQKLQAEENLATELTVQNQLQELPGLADKRLYYTGLTTILPRVLPSTASLNGVVVDKDGNLKLTGNADSVATINDFVNILANTTLHDSQGGTLSVFTGVALQDFQPLENNISFTITATVDMSAYQAVIPGEVRIKDKVILANPEAQPANVPEEQTNSPLGDGNE